jgi:hypothetical protein
MSMFNGFAKLSDRFGSVLLLAITAVISSGALIAVGV